MFQWPWLDVFPVSAVWSFNYTLHIKHSKQQQTSLSMYGIHPITYIPTPPSGARCLSPSPLCKFPSGRGFPRFLGFRDFGISAFSGSSEFSAFIGEVVIRVLNDMFYECCSPYCIRIRILLGYIPPPLLCEFPSGRFRVSEFFGFYRGGGELAYSCAI